MQHGYLYSMGITNELILFGALFLALYYVSIATQALEGRVGTLGLLLVVHRVDLAPGH